MTDLIRNYWSLRLDLFRLLLPILAIAVVVGTIYWLANQSGKPKDK